MQIESKHGEVSCVSTVSNLPNGQTVIEVVGTAGDVTQKHGITVGAENGKDALAQMSEEDLATHLQNHLDQTRDHVVRTINARAAVSRVAAKLV